MPWLYDSTEFYPHQVEGVRWACQHRNFILADDMGLGKTLQALATFSVDVIRGWSNTGIVISPITLKENWVDEIEKFTRYPYIVLEGTQRQQQLCLDEFTRIQGPKILLTHYQQALNHWQNYNHIGFDTAIFDEAHWMKNPKAQRTKAAMKIRSTRSFLLTGTPMLNQINELWTLLHRVNPVRWPRYWSFINRYAVMGGWKNKAIVGIKNEKELLEDLHYVMLRREKKNVLKLPEVQYIKRRVPLYPEQRKIYDQIRTELTTPDGADIDNSLVKFLHLKRVCGTTYHYNEKDISGKLDQVVSDAAELITNGHKVILFTQFREILSLFQRRIAKEVHCPIYELHGDIPVAYRTEVVKQWTADPQAGVLTCMLQVAGVGLNLTAARHIQFADKLFVPGLNQQAVDRAVRIGSSQTQAVQVWEYLCSNTIETRIEQIIKVKKTLFTNVIETSSWKRKLYEALMEEEKDE
jgi:SNF2 family DNA or RNA helicase